MLLKILTPEKNTQSSSANSEHKKFRNWMFLDVKSSKLKRLRHCQ